MQTAASPSVKMANRLLLCLVILCIVTNYSAYGKFSSRGRSGGSRSSSRSSSGHRSSSASKPSSSSSSRHNYPSSSFGLSGSSGSSSHSYPSSFSGLSGLSGVGGSNKYPSSSSGLSGSGSQTNSWSPWRHLDRDTGSRPSSNSGSANNYPSSFGLSGFGSGSTGNNYPPSSGLSGSASNKYPPTGGLSGSGSSKYPPLSGLTGSGSNIYPPSNGLSGSGSNKYPPSSGLSGSGSNKYPPSIGLSGSGTSMTSSGNHFYPSSPGISGNNNFGSTNHYYPTSGTTHHKPSHYPSLGNTNTRPPYHPSHTNTHNGFGSNNIYSSHNYYSYASAPQHVYINEYRNSNSRYSDILTGLALYNLGRSHSHYHHHYYNDDYYTRRYHSSGSSYSSHETPKDEAKCTLRIKENNKLEVLKIPCEIVSTFTEDSKKLSPVTESQTVCVSNYTVVNNTLPTVKVPSMMLSPNGTLLTEASLLINNKTIISQTSPSNTPDSNTTVDGIPVNVTKLTTSLEALNLSTSTPKTTTEFEVLVNATNLITTAGLDLNASTTTSPPKPAQEAIVSSSTSKPLEVQTNVTLPPSVISNVTVTNSTKCTTTTDPLTIKGPPVNTKNMECEVEIITKDARLRTNVDCNVLTQYSKMPEPPKKESSILPSRTKLKSWLANPPWWMSIFIAV